MMTIIYIFFNNFNMFNFNLVAHDNINIFIMFLKNVVYFLICIYHISYPPIFKTNVSLCQLHVVFMHHR